MFKLGVIINPYAGLGGSVGLKGTDGEAIRREALARGAEQRAPARMARTLNAVTAFADRIAIYCFAQDMGADVAQALGFATVIVGQAQYQPTQAEDTCAAARALMAAGVDLILFAGGDGTARLIADVAGIRQPVLGVPSGVKMHSGVYAISPEAAGDILQQFLTGKLVNIAERDVKDIDEDAFRQGLVRARFYGTLLVPEDSQLLQQVKNAGTERDELAQLDAAETLIEQLQDDTLYIVGPGSTTQVFLQQLGLQGSLLGVDVLLNNQLIACDVSATQLLALLDEHKGPCKIIVTAIGGQGHILGRGNQQLSPAVLRRVGIDNLLVIAARGKILALNGRPLLVDTNDPELDRAFCGYRPVITGYQESVLYPVGYGAVMGEVADASHP
ncbi:ATP-NAD kinase family protein [Cellvibrio japonicus]|uniref:NAD(+)/NADH kinase n=1 Tax=Cellvibrio japonicus (strain Ueda107) TaxID=498211 RepID=B3PK13_CELJU|nr:ATP-NAD kinase family protein [Cellvibrio japonicus]ACE84534.1 NAD(+)/NADH kinase [Cellvibrio japonicus Ueda107]QEI12780.1 ATP-NAD kinase [Cellvibrio japonicus]QEI16354.1 ATP-NAD kinase [Cellvibrio japonicus]QEI19932.1 ATP-NAD kinase [Cellvibrio japonicus]